MIAVAIEKTVHLNQQSKELISNLWCCAVTDMFILYSNAHTQTNVNHSFFVISSCKYTVCCFFFLKLDKFNFILPGKWCLQCCFSSPIWSTFLTTTAWTSEECCLLYCHHWTQDAVIESIPWMLIQLHRLEVTNNYEIRKLKISRPSSPIQTVWERVRMEILIFHSNKNWK